jgi:hypothetical protein
MLKDLEICGHKRRGLQK